MPSVDQFDFITHNECQKKNILISNVNFNACLFNKINIVLKTTCLYHEDTETMATKTCHTMFLTHKIVYHVFHRRN